MTEPEAQEHFGLIGAAILELQTANYQDGGARDNWPDNAGIEVTLHPASFAKLRDAINQHTECNLPNNTDTYAWNGNQIKQAPNRA